MLVWILIFAIAMIALKIKNILVWMTWLYGLVMGVFWLFMPEEHPWYSHPFGIIWLLCFFAMVYSQSKPKKP